MTMKPTEFFGDALRKAREAKGITSEAFAQELEITPEELSRVEQGVFRSIDREFIRAAAKALGEQSWYLCLMAGLIPDRFLALFIEYPVECAQLLESIRGAARGQIERLRHAADEMIGRESREGE